MGIHVDVKKTEDFLYLDNPDAETAQENTRVKLARNVPEHVWEGQSIRGKEGGAGARGGGRENTGSGEGGIRNEYRKRSMLAANS